MAVHSTFSLNWICLEENKWIFVLLHWQNKNVNILAREIITNPSFYFIIYYPLIRMHLAQLYAQDKFND